MKLYHISYDIQPGVKKFVPRVPDSTLSIEDDSIPRICFSDTLKNCFQAVGDADDNIGIGQLCMVYTVCKRSDDEYLLNYNELEKYVPDAKFNREFWYTKPMRITGKLMRIKDYKSHTGFGPWMIKPDRLIYTAKKLHPKIFPDSVGKRLIRKRSSIRTYENILDRAIKSGLNGFQEKYEALMIKNHPFSKILCVDSIELEEVTNY